MTSPEAETITDSVRDMAMEHLEDIGSRGSILFDRLRAPEGPSLLVDVFFFKFAGFVGGLEPGARGTVGKDKGFSSPSRPRVGGADPARTTTGGLSISSPLSAAAASIVVIMEDVRGHLKVARNHSFRP